MSKEKKPVNTQELATKIRESNIRLHNEKAIEFDREEEHMHKDRFQQKTWEYIDEIVRIKDPKESTVLDIGCGTGNLSLKFLERDFRVDGLDISEGMLNIYKQKTAGRARALLSDIDAYLEKSEKTYDVIAFNAVLHHLPDYLSTLVRCCRILNKQGVLFINYEHLSRQATSWSTKTLEKIDVALHGILYKWRYHRNDFVAAMRRKIGLKKDSQRSVDIAFADYHVFIGGLDEQAINRVLEENGLEIVRFDVYQLLRLDVLHFIGKVFKLNGLFSIIARKDGIHGA